MRARRARRGIVTVAISATLIAAMLAIAPTAARASPPSDTGPLEISHDGITFAADGAQTLFDAIDRVVPGDHLTESLWARSAAPTVGRLGIELTEVVADDRALAQAISIAVRVDGVLVGSVTLAEVDGGCVVIDDSTLLDPGSTARIDAELTVSAALGGPSLPGGQDESVGFGVRITLTDAAMPQRGPGACRPVPTVTPTAAPSSSPAGSGALPATGLAPFALLAVPALAATVVGIALQRSRRVR